MDLQLGQAYEKLKYDAQQIQVCRNDMQEYVQGQVRALMEQPGMKGQRLMQKMGLRALIRTKKRSRHVQGVSDVHIPNVLKRDFCATAPNQK